MADADVRVCARCGRAIALGSAVRVHPPLPATFDAGEWFCDWTCEAHAANPNRTSPRKAQL